MNLCNPNTRRQSISPNERRQTRRGRDSLPESSGAVVRCGLVWHTVSVRGRGDDDVPLLLMNHRSLSLLVLCWKMR